MNRLKQEKFYKGYDTFDDYTSAVNHRIMLRILWVSFFVELIYFVVVSVSGDFGGRFPGIVSRHYIKIQPIILVVYLLLILLFPFLYQRYTMAFTAVVLSFLLFHEAAIFVHNPELLSALVIWVLLIMILTWRFMTPWLFLPIAGFSFTYLIYGLLHNQVTIAPFRQYLLVMIVSLLLSSIIHIVNFKREESNFLHQHQLLEENAMDEEQLTYDTMTGLHTKYAMDLTIAKMDQGTFKKKAFVVVMDLDDLKSCNSRFGYEKGNIYIQTVGRIIKFLERSETDMVARVGGDDFLAVLGAYWTKETLERQLERYNKLLKDTFNENYMEEQFIPNFSYGIAEYAPGDRFEQIQAEAEGQMQKLKFENKKHLSVTNHYLPNINYSTLFDTSSIVAIAWIGRDGWPVVYVSENIINFLGYSNEAMISGGIKYIDLIHPNDQVRVRIEVDQNLKAHATHYEQSYRLKHRGGNYIWVRDHSMPLWEGDQLVQINGTLYDITDTIVAEEEAREKSARLNDIIAATNVGTWEWDILKDEVHCNDRFATMIGYTVSELSPIDMEAWRLLFVQEDRAAFDENMREHLNGRKPYYELEGRMQHQNGSIVWIYDRGRIMKRTSQGAPWVMIGSQSDISELKQTESMLYHSEKLNALGRLSGGIAHDMNNQLMMISSIAELSDEEDTYETYKKNNQLISEVVDKSRQLMHQLLSFTKHRASTSVKMDVVQVLQETVNILRHTFDKAIEIRTIMAMDEGYVEGDRSVLDNVFINLSLNAREAMEDNGQLIITVDKYKATKRFHTYTGYLPKGDYIEIRFSDNGGGIEQESLKKVFEPFYSTKEGGSGIGLSTAVSAIREHKGGIKVRSKIGLGTVFSLYLPLLKQMEVSHREPEELSVKKEQIGNALKVLVVDDEPVICQVLSDYLSIQGWDVTNFTNPEEALQYCTTTMAPFDCVILDIIMPMMSGIELYDALRELKPDLPVLFLSGYSEGLEMNEAYKDNVIDFIQKPAKLEAVYQAVEAWYDPTMFL